MSSSTAAAVRYPMNHAHLLLRRLLSLNPSKTQSPALHFIYLKGEVVQSRHDTDRELPFRQESNFAWLSGSLDVPASALTISYTHPGGNELVEDQVVTKLYLPEVNPDEVMWCGLPPSPSELSHLHFTSIEQGWTPLTLLPPPSPYPTYIHHLPSTTPPTSLISRINGPISTCDYLLKALHQSRRNKTEIEIEYLKKASQITAKAHLALFEGVANGEILDENLAEAKFVGVCRGLGAVHQAYTPIMGAGPNAGTLHYVANSMPFPSSSTEKGSLLLVDAGAEYKNYAADVTRCIPIGNGGKFTKECKEIYELVLEMQLAGFEMIKPGTSYEDVQLRMHQVIAAGLLRLGLFKPSSPSQTNEEALSQILASGVTTAFYPHGVGHLLGLDVHDVGGLPFGKSSHPLMKYLRLRVALEKSFYITVEPGCYFNRFLQSEWKNSPFVNWEKVEEYMYVGGVRIEDNLLVTENGFENLTPDWLPKTVEQIEAITTRASKA